MASEYPAGLFRRYKEDTKTFTTWLSQVATTCGWRPAEKLEPSSNSSAEVEKVPRMKGKSRKLARKAALPLAKSSPVEYEITTKDLLDQVQLVSRSRKARAKLPNKVHRVLNRAIALRKRCMAWFKDKDQQEEYLKSNEGHQYFIKVLEEAASLLSDSNQKASENDLPKATASVAANTTSKAADALR